MRAVAASFGFLLVFAGCVTPNQAALPTAQPFELTIHTVRASEAFHGAETVPEGAPAVHGFVGFIYSHGDTTEDIVGSLRATEGREATPFDAGCSFPNASSTYKPDCTGMSKLDVYRMPREVENAENVLEIWGNMWPLDPQSNELRLAFVDESHIALRMAGPASGDYPIMLEGKDPREGCRQYQAADVRVVSGDAVVTSTETSAPTLHVWGPAEVELGWSAFPSGCVPVLAGASSR